MIATKIIKNKLILLILLMSFSYSKEFVSYADFASITNFDKNTVEKCITKSSKRHSVPEIIIKSIIDVENNRYYPFAINCNTNIKSYSGSVKENYKRLVTCGDNVDIGVMQVNYKVWKKEYPNITTKLLLDPCVNIELGTRILNSHYKETKDWLTSIGQYHSRTTSKLRSYKKMVSQKILINDEEQ